MLQIYAFLFIPVVLIAAYSGCVGRIYVYEGEMKFQFAQRPSLIFVSIYFDFIVYCQKYNFIVREKFIDKLNVYMQLYILWYSKFTIIIQLPLRVNNQIPWCIFCLFPLTIFSVCKYRDFFIFLKVSLDHSRLQLQRQKSLSLGFNHMYRIEHYQLVAKLFH